MSRVHGRRLAIGIALGMLLVAIVATEPGVAATGDAAVDLPSAPIAVVGGELTPAQLEDLGGLAEERGVSLEEAIAQYGWQESFAVFANELKAAHPDGYAGARIESSGNPWIAFKGDVPQAALAAVEAFDAKVFSSSTSSPFAGSAYEIGLVPNRGYSEAELDDLLVAAHFTAIAQGDLVANASSGYDIATGIVTVEVEREGSLRSLSSNEVVAELRARSAAFDGVTVRVLDEVGVGDHASIYGGDAMSHCTSGFTVKKGTTRGIATAGHCDDIQWMGGQQLQFKDEHDG